ncbi:MAG: hypothetical protein ACKOCK_12965, partial [Chloroflexota bacterium]
VPASGRNPRISHVARSAAAAIAPERQHLRLFERGLSVLVQGEYLDHHPLPLPWAEREHRFVELGLTGSDSGQIFDTIAGTEHLLRLEYADRTSLTKNSHHLNP